MHIRLPDRLNVVDHFCLQAFLSEQNFSSLSMPCCSSTNVILLFSNPQLVSCHLARTSLRLLMSFRVTLGFFSASRSRLWYWLPSSPEVQLVPKRWVSQRGVQFQISYNWSCEQIFRRIFVTSGQTSSDPKYNPLFRPCPNFCVIFFAIVNTIRYSDPTFAVFLP